MAEYPIKSSTAAERHRVIILQAAMSEDEKADLVAAFRSDQRLNPAPADSLQPREDLRSVLPPKRPARRWIPSRICRCGGGCRFKPRGVCFGDENPIQLYTTEPWGGL